ncbi:hypothetical protein IHE61_16880 [Streptomyces sp. GKU 257-1]|nr:hypothetical protein [Streptomyces sp. GKU 257-1]
MLEEVDEETLWLRPQTDNRDTAAKSWAQWDGAHWSAVRNPPGRIRDFEAKSPDDIWTLDDERIARHRDGTHWTTTRLPHETLDLAMVATQDVWAVGRRSTGPGTRMSGERYPQPASMHWDGTAWKSVETPPRPISIRSPRSPWRDSARSSSSTTVRSSRTAPTTTTTVKA